ncbi:DUF4365 domain-containing protein [Acuticoccus sediminis]|uniref:DUF4365 domain-containing protein n=1 Tax=Acuticoccus sediminis TaxID=2184697 RepID=UPI001CFE31FC|nr:DUF4365 domain-containing protein [Acuticoccus sediminis]
MIQRHRSHQLEDVSILQFQSRLPEQWVVRRKSPDYGIDLEVEIFNFDGAATGLCFNVQLKATDDPTKRYKVSIEIDRLEYARSLDIPTLYVRYCDYDKSIFARWNFALDLPHPEGKKSKTLHFTASDAFNDAFIGSIFSTLIVLRNLRLCLPSQQFVILPECPTRPDLIGALTATLTKQFAPFSRIAVGLNSFQISPILVRCIVTDTDVQLSIDKIAGLVLEFDDSDELISLVYYGLIALVERVGFRLHAAQLSNIAIRTGISTKKRELAALAACTLDGDTAAGIRLALLNNIHITQDEYYISVLSTLLNSNPHTVDFSEVEKFYLAEVEYQKKHGIQLASTHYSLANLLNHSGRYRDAIRQFNIARRIDPSYLDEYYFICELASSLFTIKRNRCALSLYARCVSLNGSPRDHLNLSDALIADGKIGEARAHLLLCNACDDPIIRDIADQRLYACDYLDSLGGPAGNINNPEILTKAYNTALQEMNLKHAAMLSVILAVFDESNERLWLDAMRFTFLRHQEAAFFCFFKCAHYYCGSWPYLHFRAEVEQLRTHSGLLVTFDELDMYSTQLDSSRETLWPKIQMRRFGPPSFDFKNQ